MSFAPSLNLAVKTQGQNQLSREMSQEVQQKLGALAQKFRELVTVSDPINPFFCIAFFSYQIY
jgi:hypothetical protein